MFESPGWPELIDRLGHLWGVRGEQAYQCGGSHGPERDDGLRLAVMYPGTADGDDSNLTIETSLRQAFSFTLFQHYLMSAQLDESSLPVVIDRWDAAVPTVLGPADFAFVGNDHSWAGEAHFEERTIRITGSGRRWQDLDLVLLKASDVLPISEWAARVIARRASDPG